MCALAPRARVTADPGCRNAAVPGHRVSRDGVGPSSRKPAWVNVARRLQHVPRQDDDVLEVAAAALDLLEPVTDDHVGVATDGPDIDTTNQGVSEEVPLVLDEGIIGPLEPVEWRHEHDDVYFCHQLLTTTSRDACLPRFGAGWPGQHNMPSG